MSLLVREGCERRRWSLRTLLGLAVFAGVGLADNPELAPGTASALALGVVVLVWSVVAAIARDARARAAEAARQARQQAQARFVSLVRGWRQTCRAPEVVAFEAALLEHHEALRTAVSAQDWGEVSRLAGSSLETLGEAAALGLLSEARALALEEALGAWIAPRSPPRASLKGPGAWVTTGAGGLYMVTQAASPWALVVATLAAIALVVFEAWATRPVSDDECES